MHNKIIIFTLFFVTQLLLVPQLKSESVAKPADVVLLSANNPPYTYRNDQGEIVGISVKQVTTILEQAGVTYDMQIAPWSRAMEIVKHNKTILLYPLARIPQREARFKWITPIHTIKLKMYGLKNKIKADLTNIEKGDFNFVCFEGGIICAVLKKFNIDTSKVLVLNEYNDAQSLKLLVQGRIDFLIISNDHLPFINQAIEKLGQELIALDNYQVEIPEYLAANIEADEAIIKKIRQSLKTKSKH